MYSSEPGSKTCVTYMKICNFNLISMTGSWTMLEGGNTSRHLLDSVLSADVACAPPCQLPLSC